jgi:hypothetical protein
MRTPPAVVAVLSAGFAAGAAASQWHAVPGAQEVEIDAAAMEVHRSMVTTWVRYPGSPRLLGGLDPQPGGKLRSAHRSVHLTQFDCHKRTVRTLETHAYGSRGAAIYMSSVPGPVLPLPSEEAIAWTYDAVCELARARAQ